jgi:hypothetical protein
MGGGGVLMPAATPDLIAEVDQAAQELVTLLAAQPGARRQRTPDWLARAHRAGTLRRPVVWRNSILHTALWRRAHVEFFSLPGEIGVLHLCAFPALDQALPILGFDVITGRSKATGCFLDLSPTVPAAAPVIAAWVANRVPVQGERRVLPDWAAMFSPHAVAVRPRDAAEVAAGLALGMATLRGVLAETAPAAADRTAMQAAQARYVAAQRENERTRRMLAGCVGEGLADAFIEHCLFPLPRPALLAAA